MKRHPFLPTRTSSLLLGLGGLLLASCTSVLGIEDTSIKPEETGTLPEEWKCLNQTVEPKDTITVTVPIALLFSLQAVVPSDQIQIDACEFPLDVACSKPLATEFSKLTDPEVEPAAVIRIPGSFKGYLRFSDKNDTAKDGSNATALTIPFRYYFSPVLNRDVKLPAVVLVGPKNLEDYLGLIGTTPNPERGYLSATVFDCTTDLAEAKPLAKNVELRTDPVLLGGDGVTAFQFDEPTIPKSTTSAPTSNGSGPIGFLNAPKGIYTVEAFPTNLSESSSSRSVLVSNGVFTTVLMLPK